MLPDTAASKVTAAHLSRTALLYVRQSSLKQVIHNTESAIRQYDLRGKAISLGWAAGQITVIDIDQGHSGASAADREGFRHLVAEVSLGHAGIVLGLECSRLARNSADWHQLLELCGVTGIDQGQSGASAADREGFQQLVAEVSLGRALMKWSSASEIWPFIPRTSLSLKLRGS